jgi:hypothetical protein
MSKRLLVGAIGAVLLVGLAGLAGAESNLRGPAIEGGATLPPVGNAVIEVLQKGFVVSQGIGCSNAAGTGGGPNDVAEGLTLALNAPPVDLLTFSYIVQTPGVPGFATACNFAAWADGGGPAPGAQICFGPPVPFLTSGAFAIPLAGCKLLPGDTQAGHFFAGLVQGGIGGMRWGYDSGGGAILGDAWIRASGCGAFTWGELGGFGLPGAWVFRVTLDAQPPIEVEEFSWGEIKARYQ